MHITNTTAAACADARQAKEYARGYRDGNWPGSVDLSTDGESDCYKAGFQARANELEQMEFDRKLRSADTAEA